MGERSNVRYGSRPAPEKVIRRCWLAAMVGAAPLLLSAPLTGQGALADYQRAERFLPENAERLVFRADVAPRWIDEQDRLWYRNSIPAGEEFVLVDARRGSRGHAFDHDRLAQTLNRSLGETVSPHDFPFDEIRLTPRSDSVGFRIREERWSCSLSSYECLRSPVEELPGGRSPDGKWEAFVREHDLFVRSLETGAEVRLTTDGEEAYAYGSQLPNPLRMIEERTQEPKQSPAVFWSPDSRRLLSYRIDSRKAGRLTVVQHAPEHQMRPVGYSYVYPLPQDSALPSIEPVLFAADGWHRIAVPMEPIQMQYYGGTSFNWSKDGTRAHVVVADRGYTRREVREIDAATGAVRVVIEEVGNPFVDTSRGTLLEFLDGGRRVLWGSERDGFRHLYLFDAATGEVVLQLTRGAWEVDAIQRVDEKEGAVYFTARGREPGRDPYLVHAYRVGLDGRGLRLLTPEAAEHEVSVSPSGDFFVDSYSLPDQPPVTVLRRSSDGRVICELERAETERLLTTGWRAPEPFVANARDGVTDIYGIIWRPSTFDPSRRYPVVEQVYTGPHSFFVPKGFRAYRNAAQSMAELGFIVVQVDALGTAGRGKEFQKHSYRNLGDMGLEDHIAWLRQAAAKYPYMDLDRVGIYGHSAGGYNAAHALLARPDFYKVAVASAGNHDHQLDKAWWNTQWMGYPVDDHYREQSNLAIAPELEGKLLLVHGDIDENVPVSATLRLVDELIKANRDFDLLIMPNQPHALGRHPYFIRRRWDYFVEHLLGVEPPKHFRIAKPTN
jgi:dipeptidyl-peptidase-4